MTVSSRTPEGEPGRCPVCGHAVRVEPSRPPGDAPCPACGALLWFAPTAAGPRFFDTAAVERLADRLGVSADALRAGRWAEAGVDSLDVAEALMDLDEHGG